MTPRFSIVTCTWNSASWLQTSIDSVLMQDNQDFEYIFVDGASSDGTLEIIRAVPRPYRLLQGVAGGISRAMNAGLCASTGEIVAYLHSDDYYLNPSVLSTVVQNMDDDAGWLFGRTMTDLDGELVPEDYVAPRFCYSQLLRGNFIPHPATFVRRELMLRVGGFDEGLKYAMDYDLWLKIAPLAQPIQLDLPLVAFREHAGSLSTSNRLAAMEEDLQVRLEHAGTGSLPKLLHTARYHVRRLRAIRAQNASGGLRQ